MADPSRFLSSFFSVFKQQRGNRKLKLSGGNENQARLRNPVALPEEISRQFSLDEIRAATSNFDRELDLGNGGFGHVYKGFFDDGKLVVAVTVLNPISTEGFNEFQTEPPLLCQLHHQNLVRLIGFCYDEGLQILVYEYMRNGRLRDHLYGYGYDPLSWKQRLEICIGVARGLHYLHTGAKQAIIYHDVTSSNILLDDKWVSKLCDFGLSKLCPRSKSKTSEKKIIISPVKGTLGYLDPEVFRNYELSEKPDIYSFGVVLFEVLCARRVIDRDLNKNQVWLVSWARRSIREGTICNIIDPYLKGRIAPECFKIFVDIAFSCTYEEGDRRPDMGEVEVMLERALELQEKADSDTMHLASNGEYMYEEVSDFAFVPEYSSGEESDSGISGTFSRVDSSDEAGDSGITSPIPET